MLWRYVDSSSELLDAGHFVREVWFVSSVLMVDCDASLDGGLEMLDYLIVIDIKIVVVYIFVVLIFSVVVNYG